MRWSPPSLTLHCMTFAGDKLPPLTEAFFHLPAQDSPGNFHFFWMGETQNTLISVRPLQVPQIFKWEGLNPIPLRASKYSIYHCATFLYLTQLRHFFVFWVCLFSICFHYFMCPHLCSIWILGARREGEPPCGYWDSNPGLFTTSALHHWANSPTLSVCLKIGFFCVAQTVLELTENRHHPTPHLLPSLENAL